MMFKLLKKIYLKLSLIYHYSSSERFSKYIRKKGVLIGENTSFRARTTNIDLTRPSLISIGKDCYFNEHFTILTHDYVSKVFKQCGMEFLPSSGKVVIGNNVSTGTNVTILKGVTIGNNVFIGANSVVTKDIPSNTIAAGVPCRAIMSLEDYYIKRQSQCVNESLEYARSIKERFNRKPVLSDFWEEFPLFINVDNIDKYPDFLPVIKRQCGPSYESFITNHKSVFVSFEDFLNKAGIDEE